jgi:glycosyltransferase involved in cell wall biosynthesis
MNSLCSQSFRNIQLIVVNDGGDPERTETIVRNRCGDGEYLSVSFVHHEHAQGRWKAANAGLKIADQEFIHIHDDDDTLHPEFYRRMVSELRGLGEEYFAVCSLIECIDESRNKNGIKEKRRFSWPENRKGICLAEMAVANQIVPIGLVYRRSSHDQVGPFWQELPVLGDWEFYLRAMQYKSVKLICETLAFYHLRPHSSDRSANSIRGNIQDHYNYDAYIRDYYYRNRDDYPHLSDILQQGRITRDSRKLIQQTGSPLRLLLRMLLRSDR